MISMISLVGNIFEEEYQRLRMDKEPLQELRKECTAKR